MKFGKMYVSIHDQHSCKMLQNELKLLMSYQQQGVWARFLARPVRIFTERWTEWNAYYAASYLWEPRN